jgi:uncharacterized protein (TIRG00374 family)
MSKVKGRVWFLIRLCVSLGLLIYLASLIDWGKAVRTIKATSPLAMLVPLVTLTGLAVASLRWRLILADNGIDFPAWQAFRGYWLGLFYGNFLPGVLGGEVVRIGICVQKARCPVGTATAAVLLERVSGVIALLSILYSVQLVSPATVSSLFEIRDSQQVTLFASMGLLVMALVFATRKIWSRWLPTGEVKGVYRFISSAMTTLVSLKGYTLFKVLAVAIGFQTTDIIAHFLLAQAIHLHIPIAAFFAIIPIVYLALMVPVSLGGLGVREGVMVFLLSRLGVSTSDAVTLSFLVYLNRLLVGGIGGGMQLMETLWSNRPSQTLA